MEVVGGEVVVGRLGEGRGGAWAKGVQWRLLVQGLWLLVEIYLVEGGVEGYWGGRFGGFFGAVEFYDLVVEVADCLGADGGVLPLPTFDTDLPILYRGGKRR